MSRMPVVFFGHGSPMIALDDNAVTQRWRQIAQAAGKPKGIVCVSAHWCTRGTAVTAMARPPTIHDFGAFPQALHDMQYPAPGDPGLARRMAELLAPEPVAQDQDWGLDHGAWTVLVHAYPGADVPVVQLSLDVDKDPAAHFETGRRLRALRDEGVLIMGTGNIVHNLREMNRDPATPAYDWGARFNDRIREAVAQDRPQQAVAYRDLGPDAARSVPTPDHYWPLLYVLGARHEDDEATFGPDHIEYGSVGMTSFVLQQAA